MIFLVSLLVVAARAETAVFVCRGAFAVRQSLCKSIPQNFSDIVPSENFSCSEALSPGDFASVLKSSPNSKSLLPSLDFSSGPLLAYSLTLINAPTSIGVSFGDCASASSLPWLEQGTDYLALILVNKQASEESAALNSGTTHARKAIDVRAAVRYYDVKGLADSNSRAALADQLMGCQTSSNGACQLGFNTQVVAKTGTVELGQFW